MIAVLLAAGAAMGWGATDFLGGAIRRDTPVLVVVAISQLIGVALLVPVLALRGALPPADPRLLLACAAGASVTLELSLVFAALSRGQAFITAPVGALGAAAAVMVGLLGGEVLDVPIAAGLVCALAGGAISAWTSGSGSAGYSAIRTAGICIGAAAAVAAMLTCLHAAGRVDPWWATTAVHAATAVTAGAWAFARGETAGPVIASDNRRFVGLGLIALTGAGGDLAYAAASRTGPLSIVSAISSLYPLMTAALGIVIQRHRAGRIQAAGIVIALAGAALLGAATT